ncbi:exonuclease subunit SbcD [Stomatohabitans albus]|uniref:metallophosphoesterase family protein n=1 Tax=Stomatohabitans albus TaxID=3110766 RepID=UPI00300D9810
MKILHTADWHVGRTVRGRSRADEHEAVLDELVALAEQEAVDLILVAGDQFDVQTPSAESEQIVWRAFSRLAAIAPVVTIAGNHDNPRRLEALRGLLATNEIYALGQVRPGTEGGVVTIETSAGDIAHIACLPFLHHRNAVRPDAIIDAQSTDLSMHEAYSTLYHQYAQFLLKEIYEVERVQGRQGHRILMGHVSTFGATVGGGERDIHILDRYAVDPSAFSIDWDWIALGHIHAAQQVANAPITSYSGSPLSLDFGEHRHKPQAAVVTLYTEQDPQIRTVPLTSGKQMLTLRGPASSLFETSPPGHAWLRVYVTGETLADTVPQLREHFGEALVDIRVEHQHDEIDEQGTDDRLQQSAAELFAQYCAEKGEHDPRIQSAFELLLDTVHQPESVVPDASATVLTTGQELR